MSTKTGSADAARIDSFRRRMARPIEVVIEDAQAYWLEDRRGRVLAEESTRTVEPFTAALRAIAAGVDPDDLMVCARLADGTRYEVATGVLLAGMARRSAGVPS